MTTEVQAETALRALFPANSLLLPGPGPHASGLFATRDIKQGTVVLVDPAVFSCPVLADEAKMDCEMLRRFNLLSPAKQESLLALFDCRSVPAALAHRTPIGKAVLKHGFGHAGTKLSMLCPRAALARHSCCENTHWTALDGSSVQLTALRDIQRGEEARISFLGNDQVVFGTFARRRLLLGTKGFWCTCERCQAPDGLHVQLCANRPGQPVSLHGLTTRYDLALGTFGGQLVCTAETSDNRHAVPGHAPIPSKLMSLLANIEQHVLSFEQNPNVRNPRAECSKLLRDVTTCPIMGPDHWCVALLRHLMMDIVGSELGFHLLPTQAADKKIQRQRILARRRGADKELAGLFAQVWQWTLLVARLDPVGAYYWRHRLQLDIHNYWKCAALGPALLQLGEYQTAQDLAILAPSWCWGCVKASPGATLPRCKECKLARFCSAACLTKHWPVHKAGCRAAVTANILPNTANPAALCLPSGWTPSLSPTTSASKPNAKTNQDVYLGVDQPILDLADSFTNQTGKTKVSYE